MTILTKPASEPTPLLVPAREAARLLSISERKFWELVDAGQIPRIVIPGKGKERTFRYAIDDLLKWVERNRQGVEGGERLRAV